MRQIAFTTLLTTRVLAACVLAALPAQAGASGPLSEAERALGFVSLFDGKTLDGWQGSTGGYAVEEGNLVCKRQGGGFLYTDREYGDFHLKFDFKLTAGANNGLGIRTPMKGDPAYVGMELQILDNSSDKYAKLKPYQYHGSIYGVVAAQRGHLRPVGQWNSQQVICRGKQVKVILNGATIVDADIEKASTPKTVDGRNHPGLERDSGYICFCGHGSRVEFTNLRIRDLTSEFTTPKIDLGVVVSDIDAAVKFYTEAIGFRETRGFQVTGPFAKRSGLTDGKPLDIRVLVLGEGEAATKLKLMEVSGAESKKSDNAYIHSQLGYSYITIFIKDTGAAMARLNKAGVEPVAEGPAEIPKDLAPGVYLTIVRDPDGNLIELVGPGGKQ